MNRIRSWCRLAVFCLCSICSATTLPAAAPSTSGNAIIGEITALGTADGKADRSPKSVEELNILYGSLAAPEQITIGRIVSTYQAAYDTGKATRPLLDTLRPAYGWIAAVILLVAFVARDFLSKRVSDAYEYLWQHTYQRLAGTRCFRRISLRRYRAAVVRNNKRVKIPFRPTRPLEMDRIFVRLQVAGDHDNAAISAQEAVDRSRACVVLGPAGSGKSMLLRKLALDHTGATSQQRQLPIIVELGRFAKGGDDLETRIVMALAQNDFPHARRFVDAGLQQGFLLLLFDGLDEVSAEKQDDTPSARDLIVQQMHDLIKRYPKCQYLVTCRTAVYHGELDACIDNRFSLLEFDDEQIHSFMTAWAKEMPAGKSTDHLIRTLSDRPRILALARNPLMLTIIAFLYTDTDFVLPHSRAEFYSEAVSELLRQPWKLTPNRFKEAQKAIVLRHLALWNQDSAGPVTADRRTMELRQLLRETQTVLQRLTVPPEDAQPLLDEIAERSGLLLVVDGGERYQFSHLTLQEFFAAQELVPDPQGLLTRFRKAPDDWRETVKLWCGLPHDGTQFIEALRSSDAVLAFECVAEAEQVAEATWRSLLEEMSPFLAKSGPESDAIVKSFGLVASDPRPRGQAALRYLETLLDAKSGESREMACKAMTLTNLPRAAELLGKMARFDKVARRYISQMGNLAVPVLESEIIEPGRTDTSDINASVWAVEVLHRIGTVSAAEVLLKGLYSGAGSRVRRASAWAAGSLISKGLIEKTFSNLIPLGDFETTDLLWIWEPFAPAMTASTKIMARVAGLLSQDSEGTAVPEAVLDLRLTIPLLLINAGLPKLNRERMERNDDPVARSPEQKRVAALNAIDVMITKLTPVEQRMINDLTAPVREELLGTRSDFTREQWQNLVSSSAYSPDLNWRMIAARSVYYLVLAVAVSSGSILWIKVTRGVGLTGLALLFYAIFFRERARLTNDEDSSLYPTASLSLALAMGTTLSACVMLFTEMPYGRWRLLSILVPVSVSIPCIVIVWWYEQRWYRRWTVSQPVVWMGLSCCAAAVILCGIGLVIGATFTGRMTNLNITIFVGAALAASVGAFLPAERDYWQGGAPVPTLYVRLCAWGIWFSVLCCGAYSVVLYRSYLGLSGGLVLSSFLLFLLGFCVALVNYQIRLTSNPFRELFKRRDDFANVIRAARLRRSR